MIENKVLVNVPYKVFDLGVEWLNTKVVCHRFKKFIVIKFPFSFNLEIISNKTNPSTNTQCILFIVSQKCKINVISDSINTQDQYYKYKYPNVSFCNSVMYISMLVEQ